VSQAVGDYTDDDIRHCGCPIGSKRRQERRSRGLFHGFCPFSRREADYLLPRFLGWCRSLIIAFLRDQACCARLPGRRATASNITHSKLLAGVQASHKSFAAVRTTSSSIISPPPPRATTARSLSVPFPCSSGVCEHILACAAEKRGRSPKLPKLEFNFISLHSGF